MLTPAGAPAATLEQLLGEVQELQGRLEEHGDPATRELAEALVSAVVAMYGAGLERIAAALNGELARVAEDPLVASLLLIHDLHPVPLAERVQGALDTVRPYMESHGGDVELVGISEDGVATIALRGSCSDCAASSATLELAVKQALEEAAPDLEGLEVLGMAAQLPGLALPMAEPDGGLPMAEAGAAPAVIAGPRWVEVADAPPPEGQLSSARAAGVALLLATVEGKLLAYEDSCAGCGAPLHDGELLCGTLRCPRCERSFYLPAAGRSLGGERLQLRPVPLLRQQQGVRVALA
jgi:Fe-S cluster biogenesis protein NfuA/nitrite reductase/ring-hydroxylating ferredoxin subunit